MGGRLRGWLVGWLAGWLVGWLEPRVEGRKARRGFCHARKVDCSPQPTVSHYFELAGRRQCQRIIRLSGRWFSAIHKGWTVDEIGGSRWTCLKHRALLGLRAKGTKESGQGPADSRSSKPSRDDCSSTLRCLRLSLCNCLFNHKDRPFTITRKTEV
uniref:Secreted protein n=1 Tax=Vespula pensylvanica TaxID=30213 RepID=A0A834NQA7_VESPE|nr:hypothetical protein H0235_012115 [Vespula pensylvanica]